MAKAKTRTIFQRVNDLLGEPASKVEYGRALDPSNYTNAFFKQTTPPHQAFYPVSLKKHKQLVFKQKPLMLGRHIETGMLYLVPMPAEEIAVQVAINRGQASRYTPSVPAPAARSKATSAQTSGNTAGRARLA